MRRPGPRALRRSAWWATTTSPCSARSTSPPSPRPPPEAVAWTRENVAERTLDILRELEPAGQREGIGLFHASPRDPVWEYVLSAEQADACLDAQAERVGADRPLARRALLRPAQRRRARQHARRPGAATARCSTLGGGQWLINPGSVGQPRDGDPRAAWLELDTEAGTARFHRVAYDIDASRGGDHRRRPPAGASPIASTSARMTAQMQAKSAPQAFSRLADDARTLATMPLVASLGPAPPRSRWPPAAAATQAAAGRDGAGDHRQPRHRPAARPTKANASAPKAPPGRSTNRSKRSRASTRS